ncbi:MAG: lysylphosphatidylglycerol synthase transmembrane domain-containing protein [Limisphaerales bacterium]
MRGRNMAKKSKAWSLRTLLAVLAIAVMFVIAEPRKVLLLMGQADPMKVVAGMLAVFVMYFLRTLRWQSLLVMCAKTISTFHLFVWTLAGTLLNFLLPTSIGGDLGRWYLVQSKDVSKAAAGLSLILDRLLGSLAFVPLIGLTVMGGVTLPDGIAIGTRSVAVSVVTVLLLSVILVFLWRFLTGDRGKAKLVRLYQRFFSEADEVEPLDTTLEKLRQASRFDWLHAVVLSLLAHLCFVAAEYWFATALGIKVSFWQMSFLYLVAATAMLAPITPNGLGVREGLNVWFLTHLGNSAEAAVGYSLISLLVRFVTCVPSMLYVDIRPKAPPSDS